MYPFTNCFVGELRVDAGAESSQCCMKVQITINVGCYAVVILLTLCVVQGQTSAPESLSYERNVQKPESKSRRIKLNTQQDAIRQRLVVSVEIEELSQFMPNIIFCLPQFSIYGLLMHAAIGGMRTIDRNPF
jgi:hypothetical protein